jgi:hypothetical protein
MTSRSGSGSGLLRTVAAGALALGVSVAYASAPPTLTAAGIAKGFTLSTVVSGFGPSNSSSFNVLGSAVNSDGNIIVNVHSLSKNFVFKNLDNQVQADALGSSNFSSCCNAFAYANGSVWATSGSGLAKLNNDGSVAQTYGNIGANQGMWANPVTGHLIAGYPVIDIDVSGAVPTSTAVFSASSDGLTVSPDGKLVYLSSGAIIDLATKAQVGSFGNVSGADGMGVISAAGNADLDGDIIVNTTNGNIVLVDHVSFLQTIIASGGGYGDYTSPDRTTGTLLLSSSNNLIRLACGEGCGIGAPPPPPPNAVPEPETYALMLAGLGLVGWVSRRRRT